MPESEIVFGKRGASARSSRAERATQIPFVRASSDLPALGTEAIETEHEHEAPKRLDGDGAEADLKLYFGDEWPRYAPLWRESEVGAWRPSWSFKAALFAGYWLLYRKQAVGCALVVVSALPGSVGSCWEGYAIILNVLCCVFVGLFGKSIVIDGALRAIAGIREVHGADRHAGWRIGRAGGTNWLAPLVAAIAIANASYFIERLTHADAAETGVSASR